MEDLFGNFTSRKVKAGAIHDLYANQDVITFDPEDRPEDFIRIEPLNQAKQLPTLKIGDRHLLRSFEGASILYGFKFSEPQEEITLALQEKEKGLRQQLQDLEQGLKAANTRGTGMNSQVRGVLDNLFDQLRDRMGFIAWDQFVDMMTNRANHELEAQGLLRTAKNGKIQRLGQKRIAQYLQNKKEDASGGTSAPTIRKRIKALEVELDHTMQQIGQKGKFLNVVQRAFLKKLKFPRTARDRQLQQEFVKNAVDNYTRLRPNYPYDYVVYPESSGVLNGEIAMALGSYYNAMPIRGLIKIQNPTIDTTNFARNHPDRSPQWRRNMLFKNPDSLQNQLGSTSGQIKNVTGKNTNYRAFVRNWRMAPDLDQQVNPVHERSGLRGRRILVIDDNTASGGTFEAVNQKLQEQRPKSIHFYTPLWVNFSY